MTNLSLAVVIESTNSLQHQLKSGIVSAESMVYHKLGKLDRSKYSFCRSSYHLTLNGKKKHVLSFKCLYADHSSSHFLFSLFFVENIY